MLKDTGERLLPGECRTIDEYIMILRHEFAYAHAKTFLQKDSVVVEVGSGEGYGTSSLSKDCKAITGVDVAADAVEHANTLYHSGNCTFKLYDGNKLPFEDSFANVVVSFQVIEHVEDDALFVREIHRVLKPGGVFIVATPNRLTRLKEGQKPFNMFHLREYAPDDLRNVLARNFSEIEMHGVFGSREIHQLEARRIARILKPAELDPLGIRRFLPAGVKQALVKLLRRKPPKTQSGTADFSEKFSASDFKLSAEGVAESLDLLAVCRKAL